MWRLERGTIDTVVIQRVKENKSDEVIMLDDVWSGRRIVSCHFMAVVKFFMS